MVLQANKGVSKTKTPTYGVLQISMWKNSNPNYISYM